MASYLGNIFAGIVTAYLPFEDTSLKLTVGLMVSELTNQSVGYLKTSVHKNLFTRFYHKNITKISSSENNPIYRKLEEYIVNKFYNEIVDCNFIPRNGETSVSLKSSSFDRKLVDKYKDFTINISMEGNDKESIIVLEIKNVKDIKIYVDYINTISNDIDKQVSRLLKIFKPNVTKTKDETYVDWDTLFVHTNKTFKNTIVSKQVEKELYEDINWFINNEKYFSDRGIPYKRGYILEGEYGTGKTSILKAISNEYKLDIFSVDLDNIETNAQLIKLITGINYLVRNKNYMLVFEDIDRSPFIKKLNDRHYYDETNVNKITVSTFINILDGLVETKGRLLFFTANDLSQLTNNPVIVRPGRIDKIVKVTYCDKSQLYRMGKLFFPDLEINETKIVDKEKLSPAHFVQFMQLHHTDTDKVLEYLYKTTKSEVKDLGESNIDFDKMRNGGRSFKTRRRNNKNQRILKNAIREQKRCEKIVGDWDKTKENLEKKITAIKAKIQKEKAKKKNDSKKILSKKKKSTKKKSIKKTITNVEKNKENKENKENKIVINKKDKIYSDISNDIVNLDHILNDNVSDEEILKDFSYDIFSE